MTDFEKKYLDIDYILMRDEVIKNLLDFNKFYTLDDAKEIRKLVKRLYNILGK